MGCAAETGGRVGEGRQAARLARLAALAADVVCESPRLRRHLVRVRVRVRVEVGVRVRVEVGVRVRKATHSPSGERLMAQQPPSRLSCSRVKRCTRRTPSLVRRCVVVSE